MLQTSSLALDAAQPPRVELPPETLRDDDERLRRARRWRCARCGHGITDDASRTEVDGRHVHLRLNPSAFAFLFGCFGEARGCLLVGEPTAEATWFSGCRWQFAHCAACGAHLGWAFSGAQAFFALVLERLVAPEAEG
ncbi:MAG: cereblon family protein [Myxococcota bacterium]